MVTNDDYGKLEMKQKFIELRARGFSYDKIAKELKVTKATLCAWNKELSLEITEARSMQLESIYETYNMTKEARIKQLGNILDKLETEFDKRTLDVKDISTPRLLSMIIAYRELLSKEYEPKTNFITKLNAENILDELIELYNNYSESNANKDKLNMIAGMLKAYETYSLEKRIESLENLFKKEKEI